MKLLALLFLVVAALSAVLLLDPIPQDPAYHDFADTRRLLGVANFWNVCSNIALVAAGIAGLAFLKDSDRAGILAELYPVYALFFGGVLLSGFGSAWYHLRPANVTLLWDRLPMTIAFMSFFTLILGEQISASAARRWFLPLLAVGAASVSYWFVTETSTLLCGLDSSMTCGDLRPYALVQFLPLILIPLLLLAGTSPFDRSAFFWIMILLYAAAKLFEYLDREIFAATGLISGHTIKHVVAAAAALACLSGLARRQPVPDDTSP